MPRTRESHPPSLTAKVAIEGYKTTTQTARMFALTRRKLAAGRNRRCPVCQTYSATAARPPVKRRTNQQQNSKRWNKELLP